MNLKNINRFIKILPLESYALDKVIEVLEESKEDPKCGLILMMENMVQSKSSHAGSYVGGIMIGLTLAMLEEQDGVNEVVDKFNAFKKKATKEDLTDVIMKAMKRFGGVDTTRPEYDARAMAEKLKKEWQEKHPGEDVEVVAVDQKTGKQVASTIDLGSEEPDDKFCDRDSLRGLV